MPIRTRRLAAGIACAITAGSFGLPAAGWAQATSAPASPSSAAPPASATQLGKITVTAQSRTQEVQDVPIALNILTAQQLDTVAATEVTLDAATGKVRTLPAAKANSTAADAKDPAKTTQQRS